MESIRMLKIEPLKPPVVIEVGHSLENLRKLVGGTIQAVYPWREEACLLCDDEGKIKGYPANRVLLDEEGVPYDIVVGTFFICGLTADNFGSISDEMIDKFTDRFRYPEMFMLTMDDHVLWFRLGSGEEPKIII